MNDLDWNDYFDNDREAGGEEYKEPVNKPDQLKEEKTFNWSAPAAPIRRR